jgi:hypothetical protein
MNKRKVSSLIFTFALIICSLFTSSLVTLASTNEKETVQLNAKIAADDTLSYYISTSDTERGVLISKGTLKQVVTSSYKLTQGNKYYIHVEAKDTGGAIAGFIGRFDLNGTGFKFKDGSNVLITDISSFRVSRTGFGKNYEEPTTLKGLSASFSAVSKKISPANWIWTNSGKDLHCTRYFSAEIIPESPIPSITATATGSAIGVDLSWTTLENATSYSVKRSTTQGGPYETISTDISINSYIDKDVVNGTTYYYIITVKISDTESVDSNEVSAIPLKINNVLKVVLEVKEQLQLSVDEDLDENLEMIWTSTNDTIATVDPNGVVTALAPGNTMITVTSVDGSYTDYVNVLVVDDAKEYRLAVDLRVGKSCRLTVDDLTDTVNVNWTSLNPTVATVTSKGKVTAVGEGLTVVIAIDEEGNEIGQIYIRIRE